MIEQRVIKIGGSLLDLPDLGSRLKRWLQTAPPRQNVFLMGGGNFCNELRELHDRFRLHQSFSHQLSLELMGVTAQLLGRLLGFSVTQQFESLAGSNQDQVFDCLQWVADQESIPQTWDVTSDSIAALLAKELGAELCLMKSVDSTTAVDAYFSQAADGLKRVEFVNLRTRP